MAKQTRSHAARTFDRLVTIFGSVVVAASVALQVTVDGQPVDMSSGQGWSTVALAIVTGIFLTWQRRTFVR